MTYSINIFRLGLLLIIITMASLSTSTAQSIDCDHTIEGKVIDMETNQPLPFATIVIEETGQSEVSDANGLFSLRGICNEEIHLEVKFLGYKTACLLYTSPSPRDRTRSRMPSSA